MFCAHCGMTVEATNKYCVYCGKEILYKPEAAICAHCGAVMVPDRRFCSQCGTSAAVSPSDAAHPYSPAPAQPSPEASTVKPVKRKTGLVVFIFMLFAILAGGCIGGGLYVKMYGWEAVPYYHEITALWMGAPD